MKKALVIVFTLSLIVGTLSSCGGGSIYASAPHEGVIRLHILANSNSDADQSTKLEVRNLLLKDWAGALAKAGGAEAAWEELDALLPDIQKDIVSFLDQEKAGYGAKLATGVYDFPDRDYNGVAFPAGQYRALRVELGAGEGHNWWCVMFPPLCLIGENGEMDMQQYIDLIKKLEEEGVTPEDKPEAPVRSWLFDSFFGQEQWDEDFYGWAKETWTGGGK